MTANDETAEMAMTAMTDEATTADIHDERVTAEIAGGEATAQKVEDGREMETTATGVTAESAPLHQRSVEKIVAVKQEMGTANRDEVGPSRQSICLTLTCLP